MTDVIVLVGVTWGAAHNTTKDYNVMMISSIQREDAVKAQP